MTKRKAIFFLTQAIHFYIKDNHLISSQALEFQAIIMTSWCNKN